MNKVIITMFLFIFSISLFAEEIMIFDMAGNVKINNKSIELPYTINLNEKVSIDNNSYIELMFEDGTTYKFEKTGVYSLDTIVKSAKKTIEKGEENWVNDIMKTEIKDGGENFTVATAGTKADRVENVIKNLLMWDNSEQIKNYKPSDYIRATRILLKNGKYNEVISMINSNLDKFKTAKRAEALYLLGSAYYRLNDEQHKNEVFNKLINNYPHSKWAKVAKLLIRS